MRGPGTFLLGAIGILWVAWGSTGCINVAAMTFYTYEGVLVDAASGLPLVGASVVATFRDPRGPEEAALGPPLVGESFVATLRDREWPEMDEVLSEDVTAGRGSQTDSRGRYRGEFGGDGWGYTLLFGFIPLSSTKPPVPPLLGNILVYAKVNGHWRKYLVPLPREAQPAPKPGKRHLIIPKLELDCR